MSEDEGTGSIHQLDDRTIRQIAAGEVVERPASVVKELVENALDADASRVAVAVERGGKDGVRVRDDGVGMTADELAMAVEEHTTSKIGDIDDLSAGVGTLGFRGEALHTISAVSRTTIRSRPPDADRGHELVVEGGDVGEVRPVGCPPGTVVEVEDLFYNTPARRKFLKADATEFDHVNTVVTQYALANPEVAVSLEHDGRETFATDGRGDPASAVLAVYGREVAESMVEVEWTGDGPVEAVHGLVSHPETTRSARDYLSTFVNGRYVPGATLREAVLDAYGGQLASDRYPFAVLFVEMPPASVDVNVHPRKMAVNYQQPEEVKRIVRTAVEDALREEGILRSSAPRGRSAPDETEIDPAPPSEYAVLDPSSTPDDADESAIDSADEADTGGTGEPATDDAEPIQPTSSPPRSSSEDVRPRSTPSGPTSDSTPSATPHPRPSRSTTASELDTQTTLSGDDAHPTTRYDNFPDLRVLGQLRDTYIVAETDDGLVLIDQHAADERVNYERLRERFEGDTTTQVLAEPVEVELTTREASVFDAHEDALSQLGFHADRVDSQTVQVTTVPTVVAESVGATLVRDILTSLVDDEQTAEDTVDAVADDLLADMACHPSIKGKTSLTDGSVANLLTALDDCENPWACPHGRPVLIRIDSDEIDSRFERDYPGH